MAEKIIFEAIFHHIVERSQLLKELAGEKAKEEMVEKRRSTNTVRTESETSENS